MIFLKMIFFTGLVLMAAVVIAIAKLIFDRR